MRLDLAFENPLPERVEADAVDEFSRALDVPNGEIGILADFERAGLIENAQRPRCFAGDACDAFLDRHAEEH